MTSAKTPSPNEKTSPLTIRRKHVANPSYSPLEKAQAVLTVWTDRAKPVQVCRQLRINWTTFQQWQSRAMEGMLQALETRRNLAHGSALSPRLQELLQKQSRAPSTERLTQRLTQLQQSKIAPASAPGS